MAKYKYWSIGGGWKKEDGKVSWTVNAEDVAKVAEETGKTKLRVFIDPVKEKKSDNSPDFKVTAIIGEANAEAPKPKHDEDLPF
jgi:hypothetical protein